MNNFVCLTLSVYPRNGTPILFPHDMSDQPQFKCRQCQDSWQQHNTQAGSQVYAGLHGFWAVWQKSGLTAGLQYFFFFSLMYVLKSDMQIDHWRRCYPQPTLKNILVLHQANLDRITRHRMRLSLAGPTSRTLAPHLSPLPALWRSGGMHRMLVMLVCFVRQIENGTRIQFTEAWNIMINWNYKNTHTKFRQLPLLYTRMTRRVSECFCKGQMMDSVVHTNTCTDEWDWFMWLPHWPLFGSPGDVTSTMNSEYCLSTTMRPHPLTLPTVTPLTVLSVAVQSKQCESAE